MGLIRESVDFFVINKELTQEEQRKISAYIRAEKEKEIRKQANRIKRAAKNKLVAKSK